MAHPTEKVYKLDEYGCIEQVFEDKYQAGKELGLCIQTVKSRCWRVANLDPKHIVKLTWLCWAKDFDYVRNKYYVLT